MLGLAIPTPNTLPFHVKRVSESNSVVVEPIVTSSFSVALFKAVIGEDGKLVRSEASPNNLPNEPVEVNEPLIFPLALIFPVTDNFSLGLVSFMPTLPPIIFTASESLFESLSYL